MVRTPQWKFCLALVGALVQGGCGVSTSPPGPASGPSPASASSRADSVRALEAASVEPIQVSFDEGTDGVRTLRGRFSAAGGDRVQAARDFLRCHAARFGLAVDLAGLEEARRVETPGGVVVTFAQSHRGLAVFGGVVLVAFDLDGDIIHVRNAAGLGLDLEVTPVRGADDALRRAGEHLGVWLARSTPEPRLMVVRGGKGHPGWHLAWRVEAQTDVGFLGTAGRPGAAGRPGDWYVFVSADTGRVVRALDRLRYGGAPCVACNPSSNPACGLVLFENPVDALNDPYLTNGTNVDAVQTGCALTNLTSNTALDGLYANTSLSTPRVAPPYDALRSAWQTALDEVNVYFHVNRAKEYLNSLGHSGVMSYSITIDAHDGSLGDNSYYSSADLELHFGEGGVDDAQDADVVYHEYGHAIQDDQVPGYGVSAEGGATGEGFGDYWAAAITDGSFCHPELGPACIAGWDAVSYNPYDGSVGSGCLRRLDSSKQYPADFVWEVHADGEMWSAALWSLRGQVGGTTADVLVVQAHNYLTPGADFINAADALVSADLALHGGANADAIHDAMRARGIPRTQTPAATANMSAFVAYACSTGHSYASGDYTECSYTVPGADRVRFRFSTFNTESGWDYVYISDPDYLQVERLSGNLGSNVLTAAVPGDTVVARFKADGSVQRYGFDIDRVYYAVPTCTSDADCDDNNPCNGVETCQPGIGCQAGTPPSCSDFNPCTDDYCDVAAGGCGHVYNTAFCSDGNACTAPDQCSGGVCVAGPPLTCDDNNLCNGVETCHPSFGCQPGTPLSCGDGDPCTFDTCHPVAGCIHQNICGDAGVPDGAVPYPDGAVPYPDGAVPYPDGAVPYPDGAMPHPDGAVPYPDGAVPHPDGAVPHPDGAVPPAPDGARVDSFSPRPGCSCSHPGRGAGGAGPIEGAGEGAAPGLLLALALLMALRRRRDC